jgi:hypothetical protein
MTSSRDIAPCSLFEVGRRFGSAYCLLHQGDESSVYFYETTRRFIQRDSHLRTRCRENLNFTEGLPMWFKWTLQIWQRRSHGASLPRHKYCQFFHERNAILWAITLLPFTDKPQIFQGFIVIISAVSLCLSIHLDCNEMVPRSCDKPWKPKWQETAEGSLEL